VLVCNGGAKPISVVALVSAQAFEGKTADQARMLVCPRNGGIADQVCEIRIFPSSAKKPLPDAFLLIAGGDKISEACRAIAIERNRSRGRALRQVAPRVSSARIGRATNWRLCPQRKAGRSACRQSVAPATTEQSSIGRSLMTLYVYVAVFSSEKIDANENAAIVLDDA
jgi:hypothetical protein